MHESDQSVSGSDDDTKDDDDEDEDQTDSDGPTGVLDIEAIESDGEADMDEVIDSLHEHEDH